MPRHARKRDKRMAVVGAGAVGSNVAALLRDEGHDITIIDPWPAHVSAINDGGLRISLQERELKVPVPALNINEVCSTVRPFDLVFLACKSYDSIWMAELIKPYMSDDGVLVSVQNSINEEWLLPIVGYSRVVGCVLSISCELWNPGHATRNTAFDRITFTVGEPNGATTNRIREVASILASAGGSRTTENLWGARWSKLVLNTMGMPMAAITGLMTRQVVLDDECMQACIRLGRESLAVASALGYTPEPIFEINPRHFQSDVDTLLEKLMRTLASSIGDARGTIWYDIAKGRRTETDLLCGLVVRHGEGVGVETPANASMVATMRRMEIGEIRPDRTNARYILGQ